MYIPDLTTPPHFVNDSLRMPVAIGWLDIAHSFEKGPSSLDFQRKLDDICSRPVRRTRSFQPCVFCQNGNVSGNGEVHVLGSAGAIFVAPELIGHYVKVHEYLPPASFIDAVMLFKPAFPTDDLALTRSVFELADHPTHGSRLAFYTAFVRGHIGIRAPANFGTIPPGKYITNSRNNISIPTAQLPDGSSMLLVLADIARLADEEAATVFVEIGVNDVVKVAIQNSFGILVQVSLNGRSAWAGIPVEDVLTIFALSPSS
jgi:hypothetical protein